MGNKRSVAKLRDDGSMLSRWGIVSMSPDQNVVGKRPGRIRVEEPEERMEFVTTDVDDDGKLIRTSIPLTIEEAEELCITLAEHITFAKGETDD